ncbi:hypothetical protein TRIATDRAFT_322502 [Trichoderma atroviride IMI 206040]|uniref:Chromo domain-containing protein n=1 Tax=Hypocrea atroviridis (strain ATCC 20476 / IMI 206040) TaxID=452589 RepID=G9PAI2_HYPAI|nr:uncharacterized protein TRIATDRAFT_322502 [Trichoderma atroviride IMI 206040]EHK40015.1 hypothetical protein TRIATDRAFT_322502 [Trichoderma atroviride IMI 206040]
MPRLNNEEAMPDDIDTDQRASSPYLMHSPVLSPTIPSSTYRFASLINSPFSPIYSAVGALAPSPMERGDALEDDTERPLQPKKARKVSTVSAEPRTSTRLRLATLQKKDPKPVSRKPSSSAKRELRPQRKVEQKGAVGKRGRPAKTATTPRKKRVARGDESTQGTKVGRKEWEVEQIVDSRIDAETMQHWFKVKWKGYPSKDNTWEPKKNLANCKTLLEKYEKKGKK